MTYAKHAVMSVAAALGVVAACSEPPPDNTPDPCALLTAECPYCTQAAAQETCQTAAATGDDVQCTVALDDQNVEAYCVVPDGGGDATLDTADAPLPVCDASIIAPDGGCACASPCVAACPTGGCTITCPSEGTCSPSCEGGGCTIDCQANATCEASCAGGGCVFVCEAGSNCANSCAGGQCAFQCEDGAICNDTCASVPPCTGP